MLRRLLPDAFRRLWRERRAAWSTPDLWCERALTWRRGSAASSSPARRVRPPVAEYVMMMILAVSQAAELLELPRAGVAALEGGNCAT
jgi:hypothetical protein